MEFYKGLVQAQNYLVDHVINPMCDRHHLVPQPLSWVDGLIGVI